MFLNVWRGTRQNELDVYLGNQRGSVDAFCFQESVSVRGPVGVDALSGYALISLPEKRVTVHDHFDQLSFISPDYNVLAKLELPGLEGACGQGLYTKIQTPAGGILHLVNYHGMSRPVDKLDDPDRLRVSRAIIDYCRDLDGPVAIGGDFNLFPETESIRMFAAAGYRDLIADYGVECTRNRFAWERYPDSKQYFSDFVFINDKVKLIDFVVPDKYPDNQVSDHLPLLLEIEV
jgi:endonuclease/exonuclease/phosphatase (EEP) superfamily protein YafD